MPASQSYQVTIEVRRVDETGNCDSPFLIETVAEFSVKDDAFDFVCELAVDAESLAAKLVG